MVIWDNLNQLLGFDAVQSTLQRLGLFVVFVLLSLLIGRYTPGIIRFIVRQFSPKQVVTIYDNLVQPTKSLFRLAATFVYLSLTLRWLAEYQAFYAIVKPISDIAVIASVAFLISRLFRQFFRVYGIDLLRKLGWQVDEVLLVFETFINVLIGLIGVLAFAQSQQLNLVGLVASLGLGGIAIAFAAKSTLEQILGTAVLYLDRPFLPGEYIRILSTVQNPEGLLGRVESIGLRSTKIRTAATGTLYIVPNSTLANLEIENITRGKKVMVLLYFDFSTVLGDRDQALVRQVIAESTDTLFGIDPGSTRISVVELAAQSKTRLRVTFFILGSSENSIQLRKRLLELANEKISRKLRNFGIEFTMEEPSIYVESPVTI